MPPRCRSSSPRFSVKDFSGRSTPPPPTTTHARPPPPPPPPLVTVPGAAIPLPYGGKQRQVQIDLDSLAMQARGLSGQDVANALAAQNLITPVGTEKIGGFEYSIQLNNAPSAIA